jgi:pyruvate kinase
MTAVVVAKKIPGVVLPSTASDPVRLGPLQETNVAPAVSISTCPERRRPGSLPGGAGSVNPRRRADNVGRLERMPSHLRRTKIVATIGPASCTPEQIGELIAAGMDGARLNMSHGTREDHAVRARHVREAEEGAGRAVALIADLQGPKLRVGTLAEPVELERGAHVVVAGEDLARDGDLPVSPSVLGSVLAPGKEVLIDDGHIRLAVQAVEQGRARCEVLVGGTVTSHKGVNLPGTALPIPSLTRKDLDDLNFALDLGVDYVALSFVRSGADVRALRTLIEASGSAAYVIAKIEKAEAVAALDDILDECHAVMVARGDLGVEIGAADVPLLQKRIIVKALERGKPVITATQMLESMVHSPEPTRAEASDVANAILDGTSAVMLSGETAIGEYPVESVQVMDRIALAVEPSLDYRHEIPEAHEDPTIGQAMSNAACDIAEALAAKAILVPTFTGRTASAVARLRPRRPIIGCTHQTYSLRHMALEWGVTPMAIPEATDVEDIWGRSLDAARKSGLVDPGDRVVITAGTAVNIPGSTNVIKVDIA